MNGGVKTALWMSCAALSSCTAATYEVKVRPIADPGAAFRGSGGDAVALARGQLMIGNAGLALEGFRKAQRDNPKDPAALAGIGDCYTAMGRFDLAQSNYEAALALAPHDRTLLLGLAAIFEQEGMPLRAMAARAEAGAAAPAPPIGPLVAETPQAVRLASEAPAAVAIPKPTLGSVTVELPAARPADRLASRANLTAPHLEYMAPVSSVTVALPQMRPASHLETRAAELPAPHIDYVPPVQSATVALKSVTPAEHLKTMVADLTVAQLELPLSSSITVPLPPARPAIPHPAPKVQQPVAIVENPGPRLERLSSGEVALVTTGKSPWNAPKNVLASASSVRWVALAAPAGRPNIQILNAARSQGIAASARTVLLDRGWRKLAIGDAQASQQKSEVLYSKSRATLGRRLAAQFGVAARMVERDILVLVLGRDAVHKVGQRKS